MKSRSGLSILFVLMAVLVLAGCGAAATTPAPGPHEGFQREPAAAATQAPAATEAAVEQPSALDGFVQGQSSSPENKLGGAGQPGDGLPPVSTSAVYEIANPSGDLTVIERSNRMIVKNADIRLTVKDTDTAIDRATQIIGDAGGYIVSSRVWYQDYYGNNLKYASITVGVPVTEFEKVLIKLRGLAVKVVDENAAGDDVTDQYVDLQSQLTNLEATRARIQEFLKDAKTVDEALRINQELSNIEGQIEQIKGRMNYLNDRSAFSTIAINFEPQFPILTATPTVTPTATSTPRPTSTPVPWNPGQTFNDASGTLKILYQAVANLLIWIVVVVLPIVLPPALLVWGLWKLLNRKPGK